MKSKKGIVIMIILIVLLVIVLSLLINHIICQDKNTPEFLLNIDLKVSNIIQNIIDSTNNSFGYIKYVFLKATAIPILEYPNDYLPLYPECRVTEYNFNKITNTLNISCGTNDSLADIIENYNVFFADNTVEYFKKYNNDKIYIAYGMIGNFVFLLEASPQDSGKYDYSINTQLHYLRGTELDMENFFRRQESAGSYIFTDPYIYAYQKPEDNSHIYLQLRDYKSDLLNIDTHVKMYIDDVLYSSRYYGDTIRVPINDLNQLHDIKMIAFDNKDCIRAIDIIEDFLCYDAQNDSDLYNLTENYKDAKNLFFVNSNVISDIPYISYFTDLKSLYLDGSKNIDDYSPILNLKNIEILCLGQADNKIITHISQLENLKLLKLAGCSQNISLGKDFTSASFRELELINCPNLSFDKNGLLPFSLERLSVTYNYSLDSISFVSVYPNLHIIELSKCDNLLTVFNIKNLQGLNILNIDNCQQFCPSQPFDNLISLQKVSFSGLSSINEAGISYINSIWSNNNLIEFNVLNITGINDFTYYNEPWRKDK